MTRLRSSAVSSAARVARAASEAAWVPADLRAVAKAVHVLRAVVLREAREAQHLRASDSDTCQIQDKRGYRKRLSPFFYAVMQHLAQKIHIFMPMKRFISIIFTCLLLWPAVQADKKPAAEDKQPLSAEELTQELMRFSGNIHQFNSIFPQEKVYLEFDNTAYFQGEVIWFKAFVTHATTLKRAPSKVLYVDFLAPTGQLISQQKLKVIAGQCDGAIPLIDAATAQALTIQAVSMR